MSLFLSPFSLSLAPLAFDPSKMLLVLLSLSALSIAAAIYSSFYTEINGQWTDFIRNNRVSFVHSDGFYLVFFPFISFAFYAVA